jgi:hypothetical protein
MILDARIVDRMPKQEIYGWRIGWRIVGYSSLNPEIAQNLGYFWIAGQNEAAGAADAGLCHTGAVWPGKSAISTLRCKELAFFAFLVSSKTSNLRIFNTLKSSSPTSSTR